MALLFHKQLIFLLLLILIIIQYCLGCTRSPTGLPHGRKGRGDNGYRIYIGDEPKGYQPGKIYNLFLFGSRTHARLQQFTHFMLTAEAVSDSSPRTLKTIASPKRVGRFQLFSDSLTQFNEDCVNTVSQADDLPKTEIQVMWVAPAAGSGCVALSAMVYEESRAWYADSGNLTKIICEKKPEKEQIRGECCACDDAKYNLVFEGIWSNETHPKDYPFAVWLTHFSDVIGASHDANFSFWGENHIATDGFRLLAEFGSVRSLETELRAKGPRLRTLIKAAGLWYPNVNKNTSSQFKVDRKNHKLSLVSMFGPSPDWVVGVNGLNLCKQDCTWTESVDVDLYPWDSGTDSGISYMSPNAETQPRERMHRITTMYPEDPRAPFYNPSTPEMVPLARLYIRREKVLPRSCDEEFLQAQLLDESENTEETSRPECDVTEFSAWGACSVTCGKGIRMRNREYRNADLANTSGCNRQLVGKEMCVADVPECDEQPDEQEENLRTGDAQTNDDGEGIGVCKTTKWSEWSECSATCGIGISMRTRTFIDHVGRKKCPHVTIVEKEKCMKPECLFSDMEIPDSECPVTIWSDWSPCSVTCGNGVNVRSRLLLVEPHMKDKCSNRMKLDQQRTCSVKADCLFDADTAKDNCVLKAESGPCRGSYQRYAFNSESKTCIPFFYGGCRGNRNNFITLDECMNSCARLMDNHESSNSDPSNTTPLPVPVDCILSEWTDWSPCSVTCGVGRSERYRYITQEALHGGAPCPKRIIKRRKCYAPVTTC